MENLKWEQQQ
jgi:hypothetical protein